MNWKLSEDQGYWQYRDGTVVIDALRWERDAQRIGCYVNQKGAPLSRDFSEAKRMVESGAKAKEPTQIPLFGGKR